MRKLSLALFALALFVGARPAQAFTIGPDAFGYTATDRSAAFINISVTGTLLHGPGNDDTAAPAAIGFGFNFYGTSYNTAHVSTNGLITFVNPNTGFVNQDLSAVATTNPSIAVMWDDWTTGTAGEVRVETQGAPGSRQFIVQWQSVRPFDGTTSDLVTFQAILYEATGSILMNYLVVNILHPSNAGGSATIGIANVGAPANGQFLQWSYNQGSVRPGYAIEYSLSATPVPEPASLLLLGAGLVGVAVRLRRRG